MAKKLTKKQREKEIVKHNIQQAKEIIFEAKKANKGRYVHDIRSYSQRMMNLVKKKNMKIDSEDFRDLCKYKQAVASMLYMNEKNI